MAKDVLKGFVKDLFAIRTKPAAVALAYAAALWTFIGFDAKSAYDLPSPPPAASQGAPQEDKRPLIERIDDTRLRFQEETGADPATAYFHSARHQIFEEVGIMSLLQYPMNMMRIQERAALVRQEEDFERLLDDRDRGYIRFTVSYPNLLAGVVILRVHPASSIAIALGGLYLNWTSEAEFVPADYKIKRLTEAEAGGIDDNIRRLEYRLRYNERQPLERYLTWGLLGSMLGYTGWSMLIKPGVKVARKYKLPGIIVGSPLIILGGVIELGLAGIIYSIDGVFKKEQAEIRLELGEQLQIRGDLTAGDLDAAVLNYQKALELNPSLTDGLAAYQRALLERPTD